MRKIGFITTSRADFWIQLGLIKEFEKVDHIEIIIFALGMHTSKEYGYTIQDIKKNVQNGRICFSEDILVYGETMEGVSLSMGEATKQMANLLTLNPVDTVVCLGDRFEMYGAVSSVVPFNIPIVHLHGGEVTAGAIDEKFRHAITKLADYHFATCEEYKERIIQMGADSKKVFNVGSLGVESIGKLRLLSPNEIKSHFKIDVTKKYLLATYHPVTTEVEKSEFLIDSFINYLKEIDYEVVLTLGNADTMGKMFRDKLHQAKDEIGERIYIFDTLGATGYFSVAKYCQFVIGNSSSGIIEMASLGKPVVNIGNRQKNRACSDNVIHCESDSESILAAHSEAEKMVGRSFFNIYEKINTAKNIIDILIKSDLKTVYEFNDLNRREHFS